MDENGLITKGTIYPAFYNTETETTTVMRDYPDCTAVGATDDGIGLIAEGTSMQTSGFLVEIETGIHLATASTTFRSDGVSRSLPAISPISRPRATACWVQ